MNIELYIADQLCDLEKSDLNIRLKRQFFNPKELNTKDVQKSYSFSLPATPRNNVVFKHKNIEETTGKFILHPKARLYVDNILIMDGEFRLSEISRDSYKGNLGVPVSLTAKDVFGESKLTDSSPYTIDFKNFDESVSYWNELAKKEPQPCIFPYALYGLLPKKTLASGGYSPKDLWDDSVMLGMQDIPPSINVLNILKHIFNTKGYSLTGTALEDSRLASLYMSYKNESDYVQPWNWGDLAQVLVSGNYSSIRGTKGSANDMIFERHLHNASNDEGEFYTVDLFNCNNVEITTIENLGTNTNYSKAQSEPNDPRYVRKSLLLTVPQSGLYKIRLNAKIKMYKNNEDENYIDNKTSQRWINTRTKRDSEVSNYFKHKRYEFQVLRDFGSGDFNIANRVIVGGYFVPNQSQNTEFGNSNRLGHPKWFPQKYGKIFVDASNSENFINGLKFGCTNWDYNAGVGKQYQDSGGTMAMKNGISVDPSYEQNRKIISASVDKSNWLYYGSPAPIEDMDISDDNDDVELEWQERPKYGIDIQNIPKELQDTFYYKDEIEGGGQVSSVIWLEKGEAITLAFVSEAGDRRKGKKRPNWGAVIADSLDFELEVTPFLTNADWVSINDSNVGVSSMNWNDPANFQTNEIDLVKFLPNDLRTDEFIENLCKAFNLKLSQVGDKTFSLDIKQMDKATTSGYIDLDDRASVKDRDNQPLELPGTYSIGFTIDAEEEGYKQNEEKDDGGGVFHTGSIDNTVLEQKSTFSYNWFKKIKKQKGEKFIDLPIPIISKAEVWTNELLPADAMKKSYTNQALRFWYFDGLLNDLGVDFKFGLGLNPKPIKLAKVSNTLTELSELSYKNREHTILDNYYSIFADADSHYTIIECYLHSEEYEKMNGAYVVRFNGDSYYVADIDRYDPSGRGKAKLKLVKKVV